MKTIARIIVILLVAAAVAGGFSLAVNNTSIASGADDGGQPPVMTGADESAQPMVRPDGDRDSASITRGLLGVFTTLMKLTVITALVLVLDKGFGQLRRAKWKPVQQ